MRALHRRLSLEIERNVSAEKEDEVALSIWAETAETRTQSYRRSPAHVFLRVGRDASLPEWQLFVCVPSWFLGAVAQRSQPAAARSLRAFLPHSNHCPCPLSLARERQGAMRPLHRHADAVGLYLTAALLAPSDGATVSLAFPPSLKSSPEEVLHRSQLTPQQSHIADLEERLRVMRTTLIPLLRGIRYASNAACAQAPRGQAAACPKKNTLPKAHGARLFSCRACGVRTGLSAPPRRRSTCRTTGPSRRTSK